MEGQSTSRNTNVRYLNQLLYIQAIRNILFKGKMFFHIRPKPIKICFTILKNNFVLILERKNFYCFHIKLIIKVNTIGST